MKMSTIGKSEGLKNVSDDFFDAIEDGISRGFEKYDPVVSNAFSQMSCKKCGDKIQNHYEGWGGDHVTLSGLHCQGCGKTYGLTGFRVYRLDGSEITGISWVIYFMINIID